MRIHWFTRREMTDLCSTTQLALAHGLVRRGHSLTIVNPDPHAKHEALPWQHVSLPIQAIRGLQARKLGAEMLEYLKEKTTPKCDLAIIDWQIAPYLISELENQSIRWMLMDRSPPADRGLIAWLQWPKWKNAWRLVKRNPLTVGCVVSKAHRDFVIEKVGSNLDQIIVLNAGADMKLFIPGEKNPELTLVYHGRLDHHRGVLSLPMFAQKAISSGLKCRLIMIGEGNAYEDLLRIKEDQQFIDVYPTMAQDQLAKILRGCHIGLLPMPDSEVWKLASPLKMSEYAASGLLILGIDHSGHRVKEGMQPPWIKLVEKQSFHEDGIKWIDSLTDEQILTLSKEARLHAQKSMTWKTTLDVLVGVF